MIVAEFGSRLSSKLSEWPNCTVDGYRRQKLALDLLHHKGLRVRLMDSGDDGRVEILGYIHGRCQLSGNQTTVGKSFAEFVWIMAYDLSVSGSADCKIGFSQADLRARLRKTRTRLRDIGPRILADVEPFIGRSHLLLKEENVLAPDVENRGIADHIGIGLRGSEEHVLDGIAKQLAARQHRGFGFPNRVSDAETAEYRLRNLKADGGVERVAIADCGIRRSAGRSAYNGYVGESSGASDGNQLVVGARLRAGRIDFRIVDVGGGERLRDRFRRRRCHGS